MVLHIGSTGYDDDDDVVRDGCPSDDAGDTVRDTAGPTTCTGNGNSIVLEMEMVTAMVMQLVLALGPMDQEVEKDIQVYLDMWDYRPIHINLFIKCPTLYVKDDEHPKSHL